ncbi:LysR family transcriptional regulator [Gymnodinialimonas ulvae]|uniref:LysR family transcriptional regulator n=1 Tax=Gymnodinialimonas ulvae TaxID=3126504 RepID=UPI0030AD19A5
MELHQLRCLIAVADTLHFGRAAQQMDMLPASFGRHIKLLEESLGSRLLVRTTRHVSLTDTGRDFVEGARDVVARAEELEENFRDALQSQRNILRIGAIDSAAAGLLPQLVPLLKDQLPETEIEIFEQKTLRLLPRVLSGRLDIAIVRPPELRDQRLIFQPMFHETAVVAIPSGHPLAARDTLSVHDMADEPLIIPDRTSRPHSHDLTMKLFLEAGLSARVAQIAEEKQTIVSLVSSGVGFAIVPKWTSRFAIEGVTFASLQIPQERTLSELALSLVWLKDTRNEARDVFLDILNTEESRLLKTA